MSYQIYSRLTPSRRAFLSALAQGDRNPLIQTKAGLVIPRAGWECRVLGWAGFLWRFEDGTIGPAPDPGLAYPEGHKPVRVIGQQITEQGRAALDREIASRFDDATAKGAGAGKAAGSMDA
ncbi:hypothetical protein LCGC14_1791440, partial [marine sediment metagenome]